jgi:hypothetical protein
MTDYLPLIARAVSGPDMKTGAARGSVYEKVRGILIKQLNSNSSLTHSDIARELFALEEAIQKVETQSTSEDRAKLNQVNGSPNFRRELRFPENDPDHHATPSRVSRATRYMRLASSTIASLMGFLCKKFDPRRITDHLRTTV